jgi:FkbM family methyltransferase
MPGDVGGGCVAQWSEHAKAKLRSHPALRARVVAAKDAYWQAKVAIAAARDAPVVVEDEYGIKMLLPSYQRRFARSLMSRSGDRAAFGLMTRLLHSGDVVFDVGANIGLYSVHASRCMESHGRVYAFEAVPTTADRLEETLVLNRCRDVTVVRAAVTDMPGTATVNVFSDPAASGWNSLGSHPMYHYDGTPVRPDRTVEVPAETLDGFCERGDIEKVALCKVDVEGFERQVFAGAAGLLSAGRIDVLCFELSEDPLVGEGGTPSQVIGALTGHGYQVLRHDERTDDLVGPIDPDDEEKRLAAEPVHPYVANYFAALDERLLFSA